MALDALLSLPRWVHLGLFVGAAASLAVVVTFLVGPRVFPDAGEYAPDGTDGTAGHTGEARRRAEIARYLEAIGEPFQADATVAGRPVAFHLPSRDVAVTFDARTYYALVATDTEAVLVEHEMPGAALGHRLPFETPEPGVEACVDAASADVDPAAEAAYAVLGLPDGADADEVRRAYRTLVKEVHPDHGGDEATFREVQDAYRTARRHARPRGHTD